MSLSFIKLPFLTKAEMQFKIEHRIRKRLRKEEYAIEYNTENPAAEKGNGNTMAEDGLGAAHRHIVASL